MSRVSENSASQALNFNLNRTKSKLEDLQLKGSTLKRMSRPSDDPVANIEALSITTRNKNNEQFLKNASLAQTYLNATEDALIQLTEIVNRAKELAIQHSSDFYDQDIRKNVANDVNQLRNHALTIANTRVGHRYIFSGFSTLTRPFTENGQYHGDNGHITIEAGKDFFASINLPGSEVFFTDDQKASPELEKMPSFSEGTRILASADTGHVKNAPPEGFQGRNNILSLLSMLTSGLENNEPKLIQNILTRLDTVMSRIITMRTRIGSVSRNVASSIDTLQADTITNTARRSELVDADVAELFADLTKQNDVLHTAYKTGSVSLNRTLLDFLR